VGETHGASLFFGPAGAAQFPFPTHVQPRSGLLNSSSPHPFPCVPRTAIHVTPLRGGYFLASDVARSINLQFYAVRRVAAGRSGFSLVRSKRASIPSRWIKNRSSSAAYRSITSICRNRTADDPQAHGWKSTNRDGYPAWDVLSSQRFRTDQGTPVKSVVRQRQMRKKKSSHGDAFQNVRKGPRLQCCRDRKC